MQMKFIFRTLVAGLAWATLFVKFVLNATSGEHASLAATTLDFVSFFTHLSTFFVALALTVALMPLESRLRQFFDKPAVRAAVALYILVVAVVYHILLAADDVNEGLFIVTNLLLHTVLPILYIVDWLIFAPKGPMAFKDIPYWLIYPAGYGVYTIIKGNIMGIYPYSFLNMDQLGLAGVTINMIGFTALFSFGAAVFIILGRVLPYNDDKEAAPSQGL